MFELINITKKFDGIIAVSNFSFKWENYRIVGLIGPNGAGKTTLFNIISGFLAADTGQFIFLGKNILNLPSYKIVNMGIARTFQNIRVLQQVTILENVLLYCIDQVGAYPLAAIIRGDRYRKDQKSNYSRVEIILKYVGLWNERNLHANRLSYGQQKLLSIACCLATEAKLLLLDEPFAGVNPELINKIKGLLLELSERGQRILLIEHNIEVVRSVCDWIIVMDEGVKIDEGAPNLVLEKSEIIEAYLG